MAVTAADVARRAGVSTATVSYVLNDHPTQRISPATRETVLRVTRELGYRPNAAARSLRTGRGSAVLLPLPGLHANHVLGQVIDQCAARLAEHDLSLVSDYTVYPTPTQALHAWSRLNPAAIVDLVLPHDAPISRALASSGIPVVSPALSSDVPWESHGDSFAREARLTQLRYLIGAGHRHITFALPAPANKRLDRLTVRNLRSLAHADGAEVAVARVHLTEESIGSFTREWVASRPSTAIATFNDDYAIAVTSSFRKHGIGVPEDVAVMGVDDVPLAAVHTPAITTITADFTGFATALAATLMNTLAGRTDSTPLPMPRLTVVRRQSA